MKFRPPSLDILLFSSWASVPSRLVPHTRHLIPVIALASSVLPNRPPQQRLHLPFCLNLFGLPVTCNLISLSMLRFHSTFSWARVVSFPSGSVITEVRSMSICFQVGAHSGEPRCQPAIIAQLYCYVKIGIGGGGRKYVSSYCRREAWTGKIGSGARYRTWWACANAAPWSK